MTVAAPVRSALFWITTVVAVVAVGWAALGLLDVASHQDRTTTETFAASRAITIDAGAEDVELVPGPPGRITVVTREKEGLFGGPDSTVERTPDGLRLSSDCNFNFLGECDIHQRVSVPPGTSVRVHTGSGDVDLEGLRTSRLFVDVGSGDVEGRVAVPDVELHTGSGDVDLELPSPPRDLRAEVGSGDVDLRLPGVPYSVDAETGSGDVDIQVPQDPRSQHVLRLRAGSGDLIVVPR
jgi:hypothetical protein